jgi:nucleotide-binding universal stress UspA family protein
MYSKILVPVDGSEPSQLGLEHAIRLAKEQKAALRLLHVVHDYLIAQGRHGMGVAADLRRELQERGQAVLKDSAALARQQGVEADTQCVDAPLGPVGEVIVDCAREWGADLIVIGTHGRRGIRRLVMGSDAEHVIRTATVPVLLLREAKPTR